jgi:hypothetical protein
MMGKSPLTLVSPHSALLLRIQESFAGDPVFIDSQACGLLDLVTVGEFVSKLCASSGVSTTPTLDLDRQAALIGLVAQRLPQDSAFAACKHLHGFYEAAAKTLQEMRHHRVEIDSVAMARGKLRDIALLREGLAEELERRMYSTHSERIEALLGAIPASPLPYSKVLWLPERDWPALRLELLDWMALHGIELHLAAEVHPGNDDFFSATRSLRNRFPNSKKSRIDTSLTLGSQLFSKGGPVGATGSLRILKASDDFIEVEWTLRECRRRIIEDGTDPKNIVIFARSLESYGPMLRAASDREGLPIAIDYAEPLKAHPFCRYLLQAFSAVLKNDVSGPIALIRNDYGQVDPDQRPLMENAIRKLGGGIDLWKGIAAEAAVGNLPAWLAAVANWRRIALDGNRKPADWMRGIEQLLAGTPWLERSSPREETARDAMVRSLNVGLLTLDPHEELSLEAFVQFAERIWASTDYRVRMSGGIRVVSDPSSIGAAKVVIAIGIIEGRFPSRRSEDPILLDRDRDALAELNSGWRLPDSYSVAEEDDRELYRLLCSCDDLTLCFPESVGENPQDRAAYLWELEDLPNVTSESVSFSHRFPKWEDVVTEAEAVASLIWHGDRKTEPRDSLINRLNALKEAHRQSQQNSLEDDILKARLGALPQPMRISHLRSVTECPFQYFARHKLGLRSKKAEPMNRVIVNCIRRANFNLDDEADFAQSLQMALEAELQSLHGVLSEHELQLLKFSVPTTLNRFAKIEMDARRQWKLVPVQVAPADDQSGLRRSAKFGDSPVTLSPSIDVLYKREGTNDLVPMRIGWEADEDQLKKESYLVMMMHPGEPKYLMFDAFNHSRRTLFCRRSDGQREKLEFRGNLAVDIGPKQMRELRPEILSWMGQLLSDARSGDPTTKPNSKYCHRCDLGSLCRAAPYANPAVDWTATVEAEPIE